MRLENRVALVTGANSGIGKAIALRFADEGADIAVNWVADPDAADAVVRAIEAKGRRALSLRADISKVDEVHRMVDQLVHGLGRVDICVNNAGVQREVGFLDVAEEDWRFMIEVDLKGTFFVSQACARDMVGRGHGRIINISSVHQMIPKPGFAPYCAAKGGVGMLTKTLAMELAEHHINVNGIAPGAIETPMNADVLHDPEALSSVCREIPWGRFGTPEEVAGLAAWLASDEADYVTGTTYVMDGGLTQQVVQYHRAKQP